MREEVENEMGGKKCMGERTMREEIEKERENGISCWKLVPLSSMLTEKEEMVEKFLYITKSFSRLT